MAHNNAGREVMMLDVVTGGMWEAVVEALEYLRIRMRLSPYYSEPSNFEGSRGNKSIMPAA